MRMAVFWGLNGQLQVYREQLRPCWLQPHFPLRFLQDFRGWCLFSRRLLRLSLYLCCCISKKDAGALQDKSGKKEV